MSHVVIDSLTNQQGKYMEQLEVVWWFLQPGQRVGGGDAWGGFPLLPSALGSNPSSQSKQFGVA